MGNNTTVQDGDTVGGGRNNSSSGTYATVGGGQNNGASGRWSTVPGGEANFAMGLASFAAGKEAQAVNDFTFVWSDGTGNVPFVSTGANQFLIQATGGVGIGTTFPQAPLHVSPGGFEFTTPNPGSVACFEKAGNAYVSILCNSTSENGIVFGNSNTNTDAGIIYNNSGARSGLEFRTGTNITQMTILANGNVGVGTTAPSREFEVQNTSDTEIGIKSQDAGGHLWTLQSSGVNGSLLDASFQIIDRTTNASRFMISTNGNIGIGTNNPTQKLVVGGNIVATGSICASNGVACASDRNLKENFKPVDAREVLDKVAKLPVTQWNYKNDKKSPHVGPVAQDFHAAFRLGHDDVTISTIDEGGVALAAIKGLNEKLEQELKEKDARIGDLEKRLAALESMIQRK